MSYAYLFKYIIIGDTVCSYFFQLNNFNSSSFQKIFILFSIYFILFILSFIFFFMVTFLFLFLFFGWDYFLGSRKILSFITIHRSTFPTCPRSDDRRWVWRSDDQHREQADQTSNLGHRRAGIVSLHHAQLLPRRRRRPAGVRHHAARDLQPPHHVAGRRAEPLALEHDDHAHRQQERHGVPAPGHARGGRELRQGARPHLHGDLRKDRRQRRRGLHRHRAPHPRQDQERRVRHLQRDLRHQDGHLGRVRRPWFLVHSLFKRIRASSFRWLSLLINKNRNEMNDIN